MNKCVRYLSILSSGLSDITGLGSCRKHRLPSRVPSTNMRIVPGFRSRRLCLRQHERHGHNRVCKCSESIRVCDTRSALIQVISLILPISIGNYMSNYRFVGLSNALNNPRPTLAESRLQIILYGSISINTICSRATPNIPSEHYDSYLPCLAKAMPQTSIFLTGATGECICYGMYMCILIC